MNYGRYQEYINPSCVRIVYVLFVYISQMGKSEKRGRDFTHTHTDLFNYPNGVIPYISIVFYLQLVINTVT